MSYRFDMHETIADGVVRIATEQLNRARESVDDPDRNQAVHDVRKRLKKVRGLVRLVRDGLPVYRDVNVACRDAGRLLADLRDAHVRTETVGMLRERATSDAERDALDAISLHVVAERDRLVDRHLESRLEEADSAIAEILDGVEAWPVADLDIGHVRKGLKRTYKRGRKRCDEARSRATSEILHEWRKRAKYHRYHVNLLSGAWPGPLDAREDELHDLTDYLGDDHDLAVVRGMLENVPGRDSRMAIALIDQKRAELQQAAFHLGARLYAESPEATADRLTSYVTAAWHEAAAPEPQAVPPLAGVTG